MKYLRVLFSILALLLIVLAVAVLGLVFFLNPNKLKPVIVESVTQKTGYRVQMDGDLTWTIYPQLGVKIPHMILSAPDSKQPFLDMRGIAIATTLAKLWHGQEQLEGDLNIDELALMRAHAEKAHVILNWKDGVLMLKPIVANFYDGTIEASVYGRQLQATPSWQWDVMLHHVQVKPLLLDLNEVEGRVTLAGIAQLQMQGTTEGTTRDELLKNMNATAGFNLSHGAVSGADLNYLLRTADALINKQPVPAPAESTNQTTFDNLTASAVIKDGTADVHHLELVSPTFTAKGKGSVNMLDETINMDLLVSAQQTLSTQWDVPLLVTGPLAGPDIRLDNIEIQKMVAKVELEKVKAKVKDEIKEHIPGKTGEFLQKMLGH
jgi:uncharacterized protein involved in outer membrane biogenesis